MDGATLQQKVYYGYAQAAKRVGHAHIQSRPVFGGTPTAIGSINAVMAVGPTTGFNFERPALEADFQFQCLADAAQLQIGDVLTDALSGVTYFIGGKAPLMPVIAIRCNATLSFERRSPPVQAPGLNAYSGASFANEIEAVTGIPACVIFASSGKSSRGTALPGDAPGPIKYEIHVSPLIDATMIALNDAVIDDAGRRFLVAGFEKTPVSFRLDTVHQVA